MGQVAKADGYVSPDEIRLANRVMDELGLDAEQRAAARAIFNEGKSSRFPLDDVLDQLRAECGRATNLLRMFLEIQVQAAWADGGIHPEERRLLLGVAARLGFPEAMYLEIERMVGAGAEAGRSTGPTLEDAYATLGVSPDTPRCRGEARLPPPDESASPRQARIQGAPGGDDAGRDRADPADQGGLGPGPGGPGRAARLRPAGRGMSASGARAAA